MNNPARYTDPSGYVFEHDNDPKPLLMLSRDTPDYGLWDIISPSHHNYDAGQGLQSDEFSTYTYAICNGYTGNWKSFDTQYNEQINSPTFNCMLQIMYRYTSCSHLQLSYKISADGTMEGKFSDLCVVIKKAYINIPIGSYETTNGNALSNIASNEINGTNTNVQHSTKIIDTHILKVTGYSNTRTIGSAAFNKSITFDPNMMEVSTSNGYYTITKDGSIIFGSPISVGLNLITGNRIIDISTPSFFATQYGINISVDSKVANTIGIIATGTIIGFIPEAVIVYGFSLGGL
ncbi:hypothetical protein [Ferroplasma sp.]|uniref:hypothetical protein n=1 Tax=Ferroplasma sp. TaxID=2591003 RepID=UPI0026075AA2|nr:hypothetical protein [Ferroplasma sp.]